MMELGKEINHCNKTFVSCGYESSSDVCTGCFFRRKNCDGIPCDGVIWKLKEETMSPKEDADKQAHMIELFRQHLEHLFGRDVGDLEAAILWGEKGFALAYRKLHDWSNDVE